MAGAEPPWPRADMTGDSEQKSRMLAGQLYIASDPVLTAGRRRARELMAEFNATRDADRAKRDALQRELFGSAGEGLVIEPPFYCDYGYNIRFGKGVFLNFNCVFLDCNTVVVGDRVLFGPGVQVYTATHPLDPAERRKDLEMALPITIGSDVWIGGGAILCPGIQIGDGSVIGAGSVVTRSIPAMVFAAGNPCRVIRPVTDGPIEV